MRARSLSCGAAAAAATAGVAVLTARGALTLDLGLGRRIRPLGPLAVSVVAPRELVYEVVSAPYVQRSPSALESKLRVLERGADMVLAAHFTSVRGFVATTLETVRFEPPGGVHFRLVRGPVPYVIEEFILRESGDGTYVEYRGELGTDLWALGRWWGERVARQWERVVRSSLETIRLEAERRAQRG